MYQKIMALVFGLVSCFAMTASAAGMADLFTAVDITGLSTGVSTILIGFIGVLLLFVGYRFIKKAGVR